MHIEKQNEYYDIQPSELSDGQLVQRNSFCYPNNVGFSAKCRTAKNGLIYYDAQTEYKDRDFNAEVDNITNQLYIRNILFGSLVNSKGKITAVIQLINQINPVGLTPKLIKDFLKVRILLGNMVQYTSHIESIINYNILISKRVSKIQKDIRDHYDFFI